MGWSPGRSTTPPGGTHSEDVGGTHSEIGAADRVVRGIHTRLQASLSATRHKTAAGLDRVGDFAHKQAQRLAQTR